MFSPVSDHFACVCSCSATQLSKSSAGLPNFFQPFRMVSFVIRWHCTAVLHGLRKSDIGYEMIGYNQKFFLRNGVYLSDACFHVTGLFYSSFHEGPDHSLRATIQQSLPANRDRPDEPVVRGDEPVLHEHRPLVPVYNLKEENDCTNQLRNDSRIKLIIRVLIELNKIHCLNFSRCLVPSISRIWWISHSTYRSVSNQLQLSGFQSTLLNRRKLLYSLIDCCKDFSFAFILVSSWKPVKRNFILSTRVNIFSIQTVWCNTYYQYCNWHYYQRLLFSWQLLFVLFLSHEWAL